MNPSHALALVLVDELVRSGMRHACLAPGSRSAPLAMALAADERVSLHVSIDERSASFLALGIAKRTGRPVGVACTSGTAVPNFHPAVLEADHSRTPLIVLTADRPPELRDTGASQTIDQIRIYGESVRWFSEVGVPEERLTSVGYWRSVGARAAAVALGSPPGPVHLNLAFREPLVPVADGWTTDIEGRADGRPWTEMRIGARTPGAEEVEQIAAELRGAARGIVVAGAGTKSPDSVKRLAVALGWPLLADPLSGARQEGSISAYDPLLRVPSFRDAHAPDMVLRFGSGIISKGLAHLAAAAPRQISIDADGAWLDPDRSNHLVLAWDVGAACDALARAVEDEERDKAWLGSWRDAEQRARSAIDTWLKNEQEMSEPAVARAVTDSVPEGGTFVLASSMPLRDVESVMAPRGGLTYVANRGANGIDGFVSTALGAALASDGPTVALCGDLSLLHDQNGLMLAAKGDVSATFVVLNNDGGGIFSFLPQATFPDRFEKLFGTPHGLDLAKVAELYGCGFSRVKERAELIAAMDAAQAAGGVQLIEVPTDREQNVAIHARLWSEVQRALQTYPLAMRSAPSRGPRSSPAA